jgi:uroporphyrinogen decarboxylase
MIDVELWKKWIQPRLHRVITAARNIRPDILIFYHSCGYILPFIEDLITTGVDILNPIQPECMDFNEVHALFGERVSLWGTLGTQKLLPFGSSGEVRSVTLDRLRTCGKKGGIVIGPTHMVEPEVPGNHYVREAADTFQTVQ